jgi:hypothetical protein
MTPDTREVSYPDGGHSIAATIILFGPTIQVEYQFGECWAELAVGADQSGRANALLVRWTVDGPVGFRRLQGTNADMDDFWSEFLALLPPGLARKLEVCRQSLGFL